MKSPRSVLFVCMGNICRSPAAEGVFRKLVADAGLSDQFEIDSAGTIGYHEGSPADARMQEAARQRGFKLTSISRPVRPIDFERFDHIIAMDYDNLRDLERMAANDVQRAKVSLMCAYASHHDDKEVPDPYYGGQRGFDHVMDLLEDACAGLLAKLR